MSRQRMSQKNRARRMRSLLARDGNRCCWCKREFSADLHPTFEHVIPISRGGKNNLGNLMLACQPCNEAKDDRGGQFRITRRSA